MINQLQHINVTVRRHIHRIQVTLLDYGSRVLSRLNQSYAHERIRLLHNFYANGSLKLSYIRYPKPDNPFSTLILHDVTMDDQYFLIDLLQGHRYWIKQVEFPMDIIPENPADLMHVYRSIHGGLVIPYSRKGCYRFVGRTKYWGTKSKKRDKKGRGREKEGDPHAGPKGLRLYPAPKEGPWEFIRLELQVNKRLIERLRLGLPIVPDAVNPFDSIEFRGDLRVGRAADLLFKRSQRCGLPKRNEYKGQLLWRGLHSWVSCLIVAQFKTPPHEDYPAVADQISDVKEKLPGLRHRIDHLFPKWPEKKEQLLEDIQNGFVRREY
jgi:hypothetical protein